MDVVIYEVNNCDINQISSDEMNKRAPGKQLLLGTLNYKDLTRQPGEVDKTTHTSLLDGTNKQKLSYFTCNTIQKDNRQNNNKHSCQIYHAVAEDNEIDTPEQRRC